MPKSGGAARKGAPGKKGGAGKRPAGGSGAANRGHKAGQGALRAGSALKNSSASSKAGRTAANGETNSQAGSNFRSENTIKRLQMYKSKPDVKRMKEQALKPMRIQPDRRWFGNTRVIAQGKMQAFRETIAKGVEDPFSVVLKSSKLPMSLLKETEDKSSRMDLLSISPFSSVFGKKQQQKRVKLPNYDLAGLIQSVEKKHEGYKATDDQKSQVDGKTGLDRQEGSTVMEGSITHRCEEIFNKGTSKRIWGELYKVVDSADVLVFVLDARDPMGTRCQHLEREIRKNRAHKHIVLLLNKVDLVPTWVSRRWIQILMKDFPTLAFHASITNPFGKNALLNLLRQFSTLLKEKKHITIGMIGYPNVGKSSVINALRRKKVCKTAPIPGETRVWQYIALTKRLYLLDCPGIVPSTASDFDADCAKVLKGVVRAERLDTPSDYIDEVLSRVKKPYLLQRYKLPADTEWEGSEEFLTILGRKMGKLVRGGDADIDTAARIVLYDWQRGRIPYFTPPPDEEQGEATGQASSSSSSAAPAAEVVAEAGGGPAEAAGSSADGSTAAVATGESTGNASDEAVAAATRALAEQQSLEGLGEITCALQYDEEDRRGEALGREEGEGGSEDEAAEEEAPAAIVGRGSAKKRRKSAKSEGVAASAEGAPGRAAKRRKKGGGGGGEGRNQTPTTAGRRGISVSEGSVDWKAVVSEFGM